MTGVSYTSVVSTNFICTKIRTCNWTFEIFRLFNLLLSKPRMISIYLSCHQHQSLAEFGQICSTNCWLQTVLWYVRVGAVACTSSSHL